MIIGRPFAKYVFLMTVNVALCCLLSHAIVKSVDILKTFIEYAQCQRSESQIVLVAIVDLSK
jgi:hypothetical protein